MPFADFCTHGRRREHCVPRMKCHFRSVVCRQEECIFVSFLGVLPATVETIHTWWWAEISRAKSVWGPWYGLSVVGLGCIGSSPGSTMGNDGIVSRPAHIAKSVFRDARSGTMLAQLFLVLPQCSRDNESAQCSGDNERIDILPHLYASLGHKHHADGINA